MIVPLGLPDLLRTAVAINKLTLPLGCCAAQLGIKGEDELAEFVWVVLSINPARLLAEMR